MNEAVAQTTEVASPPPAPTPVGQRSESFRARVEAMRARVDAAESDDEEGGEEAAIEGAGAPAAASPTQASPPSPPADEERTARLQRIEALAAKERETFQAAHAVKQKQAQLEAREKELGDAASLKEKYEKLLADPEALIERALETVGPEKLAEILVAQADPNRRAVAKMNSVAMQEMAAVKAQLEARNKKDADDAATATQRAENEHLKTNFSRLISAHPTEVPMAAVFIKKNPDAFIRVAKEHEKRILAAGDNLSFEAVLLCIEKQVRDELREAHEAYLSLQPSGAAQAAPSSTPSTSVTPVVARQAGKGAQTLTNQATQETTVVESGKRIPHRERVRRMAARFQR